ncbi:MAG: aminotransferase class V-fold PLP-dependent enzyme [Pirellulales bacterium]
MAAYADGSWGRYHGPHGEALCARMREDLALPHVRLCSSGTIAVELALRGLGVEAGDEVLLGGYDFPGNFRAIAAIGAVPVLVDILPATCGVDAAQVASACTTQTRAMVVSHLHGGTVDMPAILDAARSRGLSVVEDACQAAGATICGRPAGTWGDAGVFSFGGSKLLTAGRGGAVVTSSSAVFQRMKVFSEQGNDAFPLSELQAAVLLPQWNNLSSDHARRAAAGRILHEMLAGNQAVRPIVPATADCSPAYYKLGLLAAPSPSGEATRDHFCRAARAEGIAIDAGFRGFLNRTSSRCRRVGALRGAAQIARDVALLHHPVLLESEAVVRRVGETLLDLTKAFADGTIRLSDAPPTADEFA